MRIRRNGAGGCLPGATHAPFTLRGPKDAALRGIPHVAAVGVGPRPAPTRGVPAAGQATEPKATAQRQFAVQLPETMHTGLAHVSSTRVWHTGPAVYTGVYMYYTKHKESERSRCQPKYRGVARRRSKARTVLHSLEGQAAVRVDVPESWAKRAVHAVERRPRAQVLVRRVSEMESPPKVYGAAPKPTGHTHQALQQGHCRRAAPSQ